MRRFESSRHDHATESEDGLVLIILLLFAVAADLIARLDRPVRMLRVYVSQDQQVNSEILGSVKRQADGVGNVRVLVELQPE